MGISIGGLDNIIAFIDIRIIDIYYVMNPGGGEKSPPFFYFRNFRTVGPKVEPRKGGRVEEEINQKVVSLAVRTGKLTANVLAKAMKEFLDSQKTKPQKYAKGKQSFKHLMEQNGGATNIEVDKSDIKGFERIARKYHVDFAVKKDKTQDPPKYLVFFKDRDQGAIDMAFREFLKAQEKTKDHNCALRDRHITEENARRYFCVAFCSGRKRVRENLHENGKDFLSVST